MKKFILLFLMVIISTASFALPPTFHPRSPFQGSGVISWVGQQPVKLFSWFCDLFSYDSKK